MNKPVVDRVEIERKEEGEGRRERERENGQKLILGIRLNSEASLPFVPSLTEREFFSQNGNRYCSSSSVGGQCDQSKKSPNIN